jgi:hypothetical protein
MKVTAILIHLKRKAMDQLFLANDVLTSELDELLGGKKITITYKDKDGREVTITYEW